MENSKMNNVQDLMEERQKFRDLMNEISTLMKAKSTDEDSPASDKSNKASKVNEKLVTRTEFLNVLKNIYEACCEEISINISPVCEGITCQNEYCLQNAESRVQKTNSLGNELFDDDFSEYSLTSQNNVPTNATGCQIFNDGFQPGPGNPIAIIVYDPGLENNDRCSRIKRLKSRRIRDQRGVKKAKLTSSTS